LINDFDTANGARVNGYLLWVGRFWFGSDSDYPKVIRAELFFPWRSCSVFFLSFLGFWHPLRSEYTFGCSELGEEKDVTDVGIPCFSDYPPDWPPLDWTWSGCSARSGAGRFSFHFPFNPFMCVKLDGSMRVCDDHDLGWADGRMDGRLRRTNDRIADGTLFTPPLQHHVWAATSSKLLCGS